MSNTGEKIKGQDYFDLRLPIAEDMDAFDNLPVSIRTEINYAVGRYSGIDVKDVWQREGERRTVGMIRAMNADLKRASNRERGI